MNVKQVMAELESLGNASIKKTLMKHGAKEPFFGVKVEDLKKIQKRVKTDYGLALALYDTGNSDAMYLAGLIADDAAMTKKDLQRWVKQAYWHYLSEYTVPWVAAGSAHGWDLAQEWIEAKAENVAAAGWGTLSSLVATKADAELDLPALKKLLLRVQKSIHDERNRVRYAMNGFVIAVGAYVEPLSAVATDVAKKIGVVSVEMGGTACGVPLATEYIEKTIARRGVGKKRKSAKC